MKIFMVAICVLMFCFSSSHSWAQTCKPDISQVDKISKQQEDYWFQTLSTSGVAISVYVGRRGLVNYVGVQIDKQEAPGLKAGFESALHGVKGNQFHFGLKNGEPLAFVAADVQNETKVSESFMAGFTGKNLYTKVVLEAVVKDNDLATLRDALTRKQIDAARVVLTGDVIIQASVSDKNGAKMMGKFGCFYQYLDKKGIDLSAVAGSPASTSDASVPGTQAESQKPVAQLTIDQIIQMVAAKLPDDVVIATIRKSGSKFDLTPDALIKLKTAGVSDAVLRAMMQ